ncbi:Uncharacterised protein [Legionella sainthelensi]|uniref:hypothetical protein n=1 Tax=Legionella sainthelensi TaxID=28087 RepID=UPI000F6E76A6|nr:hypothetical protein [Legionella sainthelensi]VEB38979.1 Uncharacterised protein [Legionella sainthelensi]
MNGNHLKNFLLIGASGLFVISPIHAGIPVWTFNPLTKTNISLPSNNTAIVQYAVTNQSKKKSAEFTNETHSWSSSYGMY